MTQTEVRAVLAALALTQKQAASSLGIGLRTVNRWCSEGVADPTAVALLRILQRNPKVIQCLKAA